MSLDLVPARACGRTPDDYAEFVNTRGAVAPRQHVRGGGASLRVALHVARCCMAAGAYAADKRATSWLAVASILFSCFATAGLSSK
eukprot:76923-Pleurochrysis_carterae.AAC.1